MQRLWLVSAAEKRCIAVPKAIECGCDMFLFNKDLNEDVRYMKEGYEKGLLSEKRLNDANRRILALKAALKLHKKQKAGVLVPPPESLSILRCDRPRIFLCRLIGLREFFWRCLGITHHPNVYLRR